MEEELQKLHPPRPPRQPDLEPRSRRGLVGVIHEGPGHGQEEESDSDGPIPYRDEDDEDEDEDVPIGKTDPRGTRTFSDLRILILVFPFQAGWPAGSGGRTRWP